MGADERSTEREFELALAELAVARYELTLYVSGASPLSVRAVTNVREICEHHLQGRYELTVVDVRSAPELVGSQGLLAVPTLVKRFPAPRRVVVGDFSDSRRVLQTLDLMAIHHPADPP